MSKLSTADVTDVIEGRLEDLKSGVKTVIDVGGDRAKNSIEFIGDQIKKHPVAALAIAFGVGYLAVRLIRR